MQLVRHLPSVLALAAAVVILVLAFDLGSRTLVGRAPGAVQPTVDALMGLGPRCDSGIPDNVPSGLTQWHCRGTIGETQDVGILIDGNDAGVASIDVVTRTDDVARARAIAAKVVSSTPPLSSVEGLSAHLDNALRAWDGRQTFAPMGNLRVAAECLPPSEFGDGQCIIHFGGPDPVEPMLP